jgi:divalent metal cation (Fe/Co/Zn/Cd) transporter
MTNVRSGSMRLALAIHLLMALSGAVGCWLWNAQALALDGVVSGLNALASLAAQRLSEAIARPRTSSYPFGYGGLETLYAGCRSLLLLGILAFAAISSTARILDHLQGAALPAPRFGAITVYGIVMTLLCVLVATAHHREWIRSGRRDPLLAVERRAALVDAATSAGVALAFALTPLLRLTPLAGLVPVSDAVIVLALCVLLVGPPLRTFRNALRELSGATATAPLRRRLTETFAEELRSHGLTLVDAALFTSGRTLLGLVYVDSEAPLRAAQVDHLRESLETACRFRFPDVTLELVLTERSPLPE